MIQPTRFHHGAGSAALCTCLVASALTAVPTAAAPGPPAPPAVQLTASAKPFTVTLPELVARVGQFESLVEPFTSKAEIVESQEFTATAMPGLSAATGTPIADGFGRLASSVLRAVVGLLEPFVRIPALNQLVGGAILTITFIGGIAVAAVYGVIGQIERAIGGIFGAIGSGLGGVLGLTARSAASAGAAPSPALRTATAFAGDLPADIKPEGPPDAPAPAGKPADTDVQAIEEPDPPVDQDLMQTGPDPTSAPEHDATPPAAAESEELLSDDEAATEQTEVTGDTEETAPSPAAEDDEPSADTESVPGPAATGSEPAGDPAEAQP